MKRVHSFAVLTSLLISLTATYAAPQLRLSDGTTTITVVDGDANDQSPDPGVIYYNGPVGSKWNIDVTVGITKPSNGTAAQPYMDLDTFNQSTASADLTLQYTDTNFTAQSGTWEADAGGTSDGTVEFQYFLDPGNTPFGTNVMLADFAGLTDVYSSQSNGTFNITAPYSMTVSAKIHHDGTGTTGFDSQLILTPNQPPTIQCVGDQDLGCNPAVITTCDTNSVTANAPCGVSNITCAVAGPDIVTGCVHERDLVYTVTDNCGQSATCTQHIYWTVDTTPPSIACPANLHLSADDTVPAPDVNSVTASDDCGRATVTYLGASTNGGCPTVITRTYQATDNCGNATTCNQTITIDCPPACTGVSNAITSNFNGTSINPTNYIWFSANLSATGIPSTGTTIYVKSQTVTIVSAKGTFTYNIPNGKIIFSPTATCSTTTFDGTQWITTVPRTGSDEIFFAGLGVNVGVDVKAANPVTWGGIFTADDTGVAVKWKWSAAVYKTDISQAQYNNLGVKPSHTSSCAYANSDHAGTPENKKTYVTGGARGGGGSDWTGSWSGTGAVTLCP